MPNERQDICLSRRRRRCRRSARFCSIRGRPSSFAATAAASCGQMPPVSPSSASRRWARFSSGRFSPSNPITPSLARLAKSLPADRSAARNPPVQFRRSPGDAAVRLPPARPRRRRPRRAGGRARRCAARVAVDAGRTPRRRHRRGRIASSPCLTATARCSAPRAASMRWRRPRPLSTRLSARRKAATGPWCGLRSRLAASRVRPAWRGSPSAASGCSF